MCGIAGILDPGWTGMEGDLAARAARMADAVSHRGPDDHGTWIDAEAGLAFGHRRLAIIDLSAAGHQPMGSADGRWVICYNGECYNSEEIRRSLPGGGRHLRGHCDTEVVLEAVAAWGVSSTLQRLDAMFAMAVWDRRTRTLHLVRDRLGEKPLYYSAVNGVVRFGSELRALTVDPGFSRDIDRSAVASLLRFNYIPAPATIYRHARKLEAGSMVTFEAGRIDAARPTKWWDFTATARAGIANRPWPPNIDQVDGLLRDSVARRLHADVPVGVFLSGGVDSSLVAAMAQACQPVRTFTIGFGGQGEDESVHAAAVARHLGTDHTQMDFTPADARNLVPDLPRYWDEPFADPSQLPSLLLCREARRHVTVALSGDGGDEIFGGYRRYTAGTRVARWLLPLPGAVRRAGASVLDSLPVSVWDRVGPTIGARVHKLARLLPRQSVDEVYASLVSGWDDPEGAVVGHPDGNWVGPPALPWSARPDDAMMAWDSMSTLPDEMLVKVDRASMAFGLEVRPPLLDVRVVEAAWALPPALRVANGVGKHALRQILDRYVPRELIERPKTGFDPPLAEWLRGPLRAWAEPLLSARRLEDQGLLRPEPVRARWEELQGGRPGREYALWSVLMLQAWLDEQG